MEMVSVMRLLRTEYGISVRELARAAGVSHQYISDIELGKYGKSCQRLIQQAFETVIVQRTGQTFRLSQSYAEHRDRLLEFVTEDSHEL